MKELHFANNNKSTYDYDSNGRLTLVSHDLVSHDRGILPVAKFSCVYDDANNITYRNDIFYQYDSLNRLKSAFIKGPLEVHSQQTDNMVGLAESDFTYDPAGLRPVKSKPGEVKYYAFDLNGGA